MLVSIQGIKGSYHHDVACALYGEDVKILECLSFDKMAESVFKSKAQIGIMAIENSIAGSIIPNYAIIDKLNLKIVGEYYININHNLLVYKGVKISDVEKISSHPMAFLQCKDYLKQIDKILIEDVDTAQVAKLISKQKLKNLPCPAVYGKKSAKTKIANAYICAYGRMYGRVRMLSGRFLVVQS